MVVREIFGRRARLLIVLIAALMAFGAIQGNAEAVVVTYSQSATYDHLGTGLRERDPNGVSYPLGSDDDFYVGRGYHGVSGPAALGNARGVLAFDLVGIPAGATIDSISMLMTYMMYEGGTLYEARLHEIAGSTSMVEDEVTWSWTRSGIPWSNPGGDFLPTALAAATPVAMPSLGDTLTFVTSADFVSAAQGALDSSSSLELILISPGAETSGSQNWHRFYTDDSTTESYRPMLSVEYTVIPEPASIVNWTMLSLAGLFFTWRRRKRAA